MSNDSISARALETGAMLNSNQRKRSQSSLHHGLDVSVMSWNETYRGRPHTASSTSNNNNHTSSEQHHLSYSGAGRFWKPPDGAVQRNYVFSRKESAHSVAPSQSYDAMSSFDQLSLISSHSHPLSHSSDPRTRSEDAQSISSEISAGVSSLARDSDLLSRMSDPIGYDHNLFLREQNDQPLAQRIANDDRRRKTVQHLQRLHDLEEDKVTQLQALEDFSEGMATDNTTRYSSTTVEKTELPKALQLNFAVRNSTPDTNTMPLNSRNDAECVSHNTSTSNLLDEQPVSPKPELSPQLGPHLAELPSSNFKTPTIVVRPPTEKAKGRSRTILAQSFGNPAPLELSAASPPPNYVSSGRDIFTDIYETGLHVTDLENYEPQNQIDSTSGVSPMNSKERLPQAPLPSLERKRETGGKPQGNLSQNDVDLQADSLFAGLQQLKQSLPSRNMNPQLPTHSAARPSLLTGRSPSFQSKSSAGVGLDLPAGVENEDRVRLHGYCELSTSVSVVHKHLESHKPVPPSYRELYESSASDKTVHPKETVATRGTRQGTGTGAGADGPEAAISLIDIEPDVDPRTGRLYVGSSGPRPW